VGVARYVELHYGIQGDSSWPWPRGRCDKSVDVFHRACSD